MMRAHKIRLNPTIEQEQHFWQAAGIARFCYNWGLDKIVTALNAKQKPPAVRSLRDAFKAIRKEEYPFTFNVGKSAIEGAFENLNTAMGNFWNSRKGQRNGKRIGFPNFKSRKRSKPSFYIANDRIIVDGNWMKIQKLSGWVNMTEPLRFDGKIMSATISYQAGWWFVSVLVEITNEIPERQEWNAVGVDLGIKSLAVTSNEEVFENQKHLKSAMKTVKRLGRVVSRRKFGSANREKAKMKLQKAHYKVACKRQDSIHKMTTYLVRNYTFIGIEDLNVSGMAKNHNLAQSIMDVSFAEIRRQLEYKAQAYGTQVVAIDRFFPSSKTCNWCGSVNQNLTLSMRHWECAECNAVLDRDINAARNIRDKALQQATHA